MKFVADFHIHSHYSRATSKDLDFEHLSQWAMLKGVQVVGSGDIVHPGWVQAMKTQLEPVEEGFFRLKPDITRAVEAQVPPACRAAVRFMLAGEISNIYKKNGKVRKVHNLIFAPSLATVEKIQARLEKIGNIRSDGRPILGLDSRDLLDIIMSIDPQAYLIPAHIWTPWFAVLGSMSGFDSIDECFEDLTPHIFALETGLSSDPAMNWRVSSLDRYTLVSNSDAHSPAKLAREATLLDTELSYPGLFEALRTSDPARFLGTLEFFPEEGKYHFDGHRNCGIRWDPPTTTAHKGVCSVCGKPVTVGVMHRVEALADRPEGGRPARVHPYYNLIALPEILAEVYQVGAGSKQVEQSYMTLLSQLGSELAILRDLPLEDIRRVAGELIAEGIRRARTGEVTIEPGYDGEYGVIKLFGDQERQRFSPQMGLFAPAKGKKTAGGFGPSAGLQIQPERPAEPLVADMSSATPSAGLHIQPEPTQVPLGADMPSATPSAGLQIQPERPAELLMADMSSAAPSAGWHIQPERPAELLVADMSSATPSAGLQIQPEPPTAAVLAGLNPQQREAALCVDTPLLIVAGPGTGKTRTLTHRIAYLLKEKGVSPQAILALTFTNKAAEEMTERLIHLVGPDVTRQLTIKTFHALGVMVLHNDGHRLGLTTPFAIYTEAERLTLLKRVCPELSQRELHAHLEAISTAKNRLLRPDAPNLSQQFTETPGLAGVYAAYEDGLRQNQALDFDDLILRTVTLFETYPEVLQQYRARFTWISVDEYQDVNVAQYRLLRLLTPPATNLCAIGDPDQAIYGFRGADRGYFLQFQTDFPGAKVLSLYQNYRSTQMILDASSQVISQSQDGSPRDLRSDILDPTRLTVYQAPTDKAEAEYVVHEIEKVVGGTSYFSLDSGRVADTPAGVRHAFGDIAVLYRLGALSQPLIEAFRRSGIPYQTVGEKSLYEYTDIRQILAHLWLIVTPNAEVYREIVYDAAPKKRRAAIETLIGQLTQAASTEPVSHLIERVQAFGRETSETSETQATQDERVHQLILRASSYTNRLQDFLEATALQTDTDAYDPRADRVMLMTLHAAKGLEFPIVFIVGCEETLLPYAMPGRVADVEEERRLFYVGMTRAQHRLILTHAKTRRLYGRQSDQAPSRFLRDIEDTLKELARSAPRKPVDERPAAVQLKLI